MPKVEKLCQEIGGKNRDEKLYSEDTINIVKGLKLSEAFVKFVSIAFSKFAQKCYQDVFLTQFYGKIYESWRAFFLACDDQKAVVVLLIHFP